MPNDATYNYRGARVLVTGGSNGIGFAIASAFDAAGAEVAITGTADDPAHYDNDLSAFRYLPLRLQDRAALRAVPNHLDGLDILVNNAGASLPGGRDEWHPDVFAESLQINLSAAFELATACRDLLSSSALHGGASVIGIASLTSLFGHALVPGYGAAKAGLVQLTKTLGVSWAEHGIRANAIAAGMIDTRMTRAMQQVPELNNPVIARTPLRRWGTPEDVAGCALFLGSRQAAFVTGQTLVCDGGYSVVA